MPYSDGDQVEFKESVVEVIKDGWNVPNRIPYASELKVDDGAPVSKKIISKAKGVVKFFKLKGDYLERREDIVNGYNVSEKGLFAVIVDNEGREAIRHYIARKSVVSIDDNSVVDANTIIATPQNNEQAVIAEWDPYSNPIIATEGGIVGFEDIIPGLTVAEQYDELTGTSKLVVNEYIPAGYKPAIVVATDHSSTNRYLLEPKTGLAVSEGQRIAIADVIGRTPKALAKSKDITGGLPRVSELFEARRPKNQAVLATYDGTIRFLKPLRNKQRFMIEDNGGNKTEYLVDKNKTIMVHEGEFVHAGESLTDGIAASHDILKILGEKALHFFIISEIQQVYRSQGVNIADKHIEVILSQMLRQVTIMDAGDTKFIAGEMISKKRFKIENERIIRLGGSPALAEPLLLGITRAAVTSDSIISAASFQETTKVLTEAAISAKMDLLEDLKENVVIGRTVPVGTGLYKNRKIKFAN